MSVEAPERKAEHEKEEGRLKKAKKNFKKVDNGEVEVNGEDLDKGAGEMQAEWILLTGRT